MNDQKNNPPAGRRRAAEQRMLLPFVVEFVKFSVAFAIIITIALLTLHVAVAAMQ